MTTEELLREKLALLNANVSRELLRLDITGVRGSSYQCPVAIYLRMMGVRIFSVGLYRIRWLSVAGWDLFSIEPWVDDYPEVASFVRRFDSGQLPQFEEEEILP